MDCLIVPGGVVSAELEKQNVLEWIAKQALTTTILSIFTTSYDEYHADETASTFGILQTLPEHIPSKENHIVPGEVIEEWISEKYGALIKQLTDRISNNTLRNLSHAGQDNPCDFREIITEVMTSRLIRRGTLSAEARAQRVTAIQTDSSGRVTFSILLLPFRTPSPLKHDSLLPDLGEYFTLSLLYALADSCRQVYLQLFNQAHSVSDKLKAQGTDARTLLRQAGERSSGQRGEAMSLIEEELRHKFSGKEYIRRRKFIRSLLQNDTCLNYACPKHLSSFLLLLSDAEMTPSQFRHWVQADITPVHIYAVQDEYPPAHWGDGGRGAGDLLQCQICPYPGELNRVSLRRVATYRRDRTARALRIIYGEPFHLTTPEE